MKAKDVISRITEYAIVGLVIFVCSLIGLMCLMTAAQMIYPGPFDLGGFILTIIAGLAFGGIGLGILYFYFLRQAVSGWILKVRQVRYGDRPWMLKRAWRKGRITYRAASPVIFLWIFSLGWNSMLGVVLVGNRTMILEAIRENWLNTLPLAVFVLIGLGVFYGAVRSTFTKKISGWAVFTMDSVPGIIGGKLRGTIQTRIPCDFAGRVALKLAGTSSVPLEKTVSREQMQETPKGLRIPVEFDIPDSCEGSNAWDPERSVVWTLKALADADHESWEASFVVPLFKIGAPGT